MSNTSNSNSSSAGFRNPATKKWQACKPYLLPEHILSFFLAADFGPVYDADGNVVKDVTFQDLLSCLGGGRSESPGVATGFSYHGVIRELFKLYVLRNSSCLSLAGGIDNLRDDELFMTHFADVIVQYDASEYGPFKPFSDYGPYCVNCNRMDELGYLLSFTHFPVRDMDAEQKEMANAYGKKVDCREVSKTQLFSEEGQAMLSRDELGDEKHMLFSALLMNTIKQS